MVKTRRVIFDILPALQCQASACNPTNYTVRVTERMVTLSVSAWVSAGETYF